MGMDAVGAELAHGLRKRILLDANTRSSQRKLIADLCILTPFWQGGEVSCGCGSGTAPISCYTQGSCLLAAALWGRRAAHRATARCRAVCCWCPRWGLTMQDWCKLISVHSSSSWFDSSSARTMSCNLIVAVTEVKSVFDSLRLKSINEIVFSSKITFWVTPWKVMGWASWLQSWLNVSEALQEHETKQNQGFMAAVTGKWAKGHADHLGSH